LAGSARRRGLRNYPQWQVIGERLVREWRFEDFAGAFGLVERLANDVEGVGRRSDICLLGGNRVRVTVATGASSPALDRTLADSHEHPLSV
jgi:pterin-4a-carbinolamine dehydratase